MPPPGKPRLVGRRCVARLGRRVLRPRLGWVDMDPTNDIFPATDHVTIAWGRDYGDVCPIKGVFLGGGQHTITVSVDVAPIE